MNGLGAMGHYGQQQARQIADLPVTEAETALINNEVDIAVDTGDFGEIEGLPEAESGGLSDAEIAAMLLEEGVTLPV